MWLSHFPSGHSPSQQRTTTTTTTRKRFGAKMDFTGHHRSSSTIPPSSAVVLHHHLWHYVYHHHFQYPNANQIHFLSSPVNGVAAAGGPLQIDYSIQPFLALKNIKITDTGSGNSTTNNNNNNNNNVNEDQNFGSCSSSSSSSSYSPCPSGTSTPYLNSWSSTSSASGASNRLSDDADSITSSSGCAANESIQWRTTTTTPSKHHLLNHSDGPIPPNPIPIMCYPPQLNSIVPPPSSSATQAPMPTVPLRHYYAQLGVFYQPVPWNQSFGMERVWMSEFRRIFSNFYTELWSIQPVDKKPCTGSGIKLHMFVDSAKVRFCCERCNHSWTSMKGRVVFWFNLLQPNFNVGIVAIKLFGQRCDSCNLENIFEQPMWYPEEVTKVLLNLYNRVGQIFYGFEKTKYERQRRMGKPRTQHNKKLCQACQEGVCLNRSLGRHNNRCPDDDDDVQQESASNDPNDSKSTESSDHHNQSKTEMESEGEITTKPLDDVEPDGPD